MGKRGRGKSNGRGRGGGRRGGQWSTERTDYRELPRENKQFESYYNNILHLDEEEKTQFWEAMRRDLPNSFRFCGSKGNALPVQRRLVEDYVPRIAQMDAYEGVAFEPPKPVPWYPDMMAWSMSAPKNIIRRYPPFSAFQKFLVSETSIGTISRQEVVSMIPPLLMDIKRGMIVLDMCAAPGSKACQLIEMVHKGEESMVRKMLRRLALDDKREVSPDGMEVEEQEEEQEGAPAQNDWSDDGRCTGLLIANDADYKRSHMLIHQTKRLNSPNLIVTNHDATLFPSIRLPSNQPKARYLKFDRILADVPCSGDGTARKNINVWKDWNPGNALGLHPTQVRILVRALQMLKVGGRVVYSTCSLNPVENEAVIAASIDRCGGSSKVKIIDCKDELPMLKRKPGMTSWEVVGKGGRAWSSWSEVLAEREEQGEIHTGRLSETNFAPSEEQDRIPLEKAMRVYPHLQDTGAFFICVLEKLSEIRARPESESKKPVQPPMKKEHSGTAIIDAVDEINAEASTGKASMAHIHALDSLAPPFVPTTSNASAAARQNRENHPAQSTNGQKHLLDDHHRDIPEAKRQKGEDITSHESNKADYEEADQAMAIKRPLFRDSPEEAASPNEEDRQVHWPPPPAAERQYPNDAEAHEEAEVNAKVEAQELESNRLSLSNSALDRNFESSITNSKSTSKPNKGQFEEPFKYLEPSNPELQSIIPFYRLNERFPRTRFMVRNAMGEPTKAIYYTSELCRDILTVNEGTGLKFVHCGVKMFMKQDVQKQDTCKWRIQNEGLPILEPWVGEERVVRLQRKSTLRKLLIEMFPKVSDDGWKDLGEIGEWARHASLGCYVLKIEISNTDDGFRERMVMPLWRSLHSLNLMLPKEDRKALLLRVYDEDVPNIANHITRKKDAVLHSVATGGAEEEKTVNSMEQEDEDQDAKDDEEGGGEGSAPLAEENVE